MAKDVDIICCGSLVDVAEVQGIVTVIAALAGCDGFLVGCLVMYGTMEY